jgi:hypothetical protein
MYLDREIKGRQTSQRQTSQRQTSQRQTSQRQTSQSILLSEEGSVSLLAFTYFLVALLVVFIGINFTHTYLERRHVILAMESSLQRATQEINELQYYTGYVEQNTVRKGSRGVTTFIPIDCNAARRVFDEEFTTQWAQTKALNLAEPGNKEDRNLRSLWGGQGATSSHQSSQVRLLATPQITSFRCDGKTISSSAELVVELPFQIAFAGVDFLRFSRQTVSVEVGLIFGG